MNELRRKLIEEYNGLLESSEFFDTEILVGEIPGETKVFKVHSLILKTRSSYFRTAFSSNWVRKENDIIKLEKPNISAEVFDIIIRFIYSGMIDCGKYDIKTNVAVLIAADELCLEGLCSYIEEEYLLEEKPLLEDNLVLIQRTVSQLPRLKQLVEFYNSKVRRDPSLIFKANDFTEIQQESFLDFLVKHGQYLNHIELWNRLMEWAIARSNNELPFDTSEWTPDDITIFGTIVQPFISTINFKNISISNFCHKIKKFKNIFDNDSYVQILEHYSFDEASHSNFKMNIDSKIISSHHAFLLCSLIKIVKQDDQFSKDCIYDLKLLVRGSRDGFNLKTFYERCNEKGPTITIAHIKNTDEIIGGFNPLDWLKDFRYANTEESFIFSLDRNKLTNYTFSKVIEEQFAVYRGRGPDFGNAKSDLRLLENNSKKGQCHKNSYEKLIRQNEGIFEIDDYEVFQVVNVNTNNNQLRRTHSILDSYDPFFLDDTCCWKSY